MKPLVAEWVSKATSQYTSVILASLLIEARHFVPGPFAVHFAKPLASRWVLQFSTLRSAPSPLEGGGEGFPDHEQAFASSHDIG